MLIHLMPCFLMKQYFSVCVAAADLQTFPISSKCCHCRGGAQQVPLLRPIAEPLSNPSVGVMPTFQMCEVKMIGIILLIAQVIKVLRGKQ